MRRVSRLRRPDRSIGQFTSTPQCPPGMHWEDTPTGPIQGIGVCVPNRVVAFRAPPAASVTPPTTAPAPVRVVPFRALTTAPIVTTPAPSVTSSPAAPTAIPPADFASAPGPVAPVAPVCPEPWPLWWLLVAGAGGLALGYWVSGDKGQAKKNLTRLANAAGARIVDRASGPVLSRLLG